MLVLYFKLNSKPAKFPNLSTDPAVTDVFAKTATRAALCHFTRLLVEHSVIAFFELFSACCLRVYEKWHYESGRQVQYNPLLHFCIFSSCLADVKSAVIEIFEGSDLPDGLASLHTAMRRESSFNSSTVADPNHTVNGD